MITQTYQIDLIPSGEPVVVHVSQYDTEGRTLAFELYNGGVAYTVPTGATASISGTKPDGTGFSYAMTVSGNTASIDIPQQMALIAGDVIAEIRLSASDEIVGSANFIVRVEKSALDEDTVISETEVPIFEQLVQDAQSAATTAGTKASEASGYATAANNAKTAAQAAQTAAEALIPSSGTTGQYLKKTASGTAWADVDALPAGGTIGQVLTKQSSTDGDADWEDPTGGSGAGNLVVNVSYSSGYVVDHTYAEIAANITDGGSPVVKYGTTIYTLSAISSTSYTFTYVASGGVRQNFQVTSADAWSYYTNYATTRITATLEAANWSGNVYTITNANILNPLSADVTVTLPDVATEALKEAQITEFATYDLYPFNHQTGSIDIYARGTVPTSDITLLLIVSWR